MTSIHEFLRLFNEFNFLKKNLIDELLNKLNARMKRARINNIKNFYTLNNVQRKFQKLNNNLSRHDKKTHEYNFFSKVIKLASIKVFRVTISIAINVYKSKTQNSFINVYKSKTTNSFKFKNKKKKMNLVTRFIIKKDRCLYYDKFDYTIKIYLDKNKKNLTYLE